MKGPGFCQSAFFKAGFSAVAISQPNGDVPGRAVGLFAGQFDGGGQFQPIDRDGFAVYCIGAALRGDGIGVREGERRRIEATRSLRVVAAGCVSGWVCCPAPRGKLLSGYVSPQCRETSAPCASTEQRLSGLNFFKERGRRARSVLQLSPLAHSNEAQAAECFTRRFKHRHHAPRLAGRPFNGKAQHGVHVHDFFGVGCEQSHYMVCC